MSHGIRGEIAWERIEYDFPVSVPIRHGGRVSNVTVPFGYLVREYMAQFIELEELDETDSRY